MQIADLLAQTGAYRSMASELGVPEQQVASGATALLPALLGGLRRQADASQGGLGGLGGLLGQLGGAGLLDQVLSPQPTPVEQGNGVLGQLFGSKDVSRAVAQDAATRSGLDSGLLKKMLPMLAMLVTGYFARHGGGARGAGGLGGALGGGLGGGLGGLAALLDADRNGNPLDDILRRLGGASR